jgi:molybdopterin-containing oxidoreductase family iron-sulfur binding subunit
MGYGRTDGGKVLVGCGFDFMKLRTTKDPNFTLVEISKADGKSPLATAQLHHSMEGRDIIREGTVAAYQADPELKPEGLHEYEDVTMYNLTKEWAKTGYPQWGMSIDLNLCVGCNACVTACQAENNIPTVGKMEVSRGRELHWIRIDRYYKVKDGKESRDVDTGITPSSPNPRNWESPSQTGRNDTDDVLDPGRVETVFQPVTCMHCETAPCEPVCPVAATVHSHEGLNQMVYNRCVGTRYCSNNCPYKVRRFNYYNYQHGQRDAGSFKDYGNRNFQGDKDVPLLRLLQNPDVTVRSRGVMEKCTYCVQRINEARIVAKKERRELKDGDVVTACEQACPTRAIVFGNIADPNSAVSLKKAEKRNYATLTELNTRPRTSYLGKVRNPNPELENA